jgi:hypothetical protein
MITAIPPGATVDVPEPVVLGADSAATLRFVAWLRDRFSDGLIANWQGHVIPPLTPSALYHLPPPEDGGEDCREWRERFALGLFYYRLGPGFIQIQDIRDRGSAANFVLDEGPLTHAFLTCLTPCSLADLRGDDREAATALLEEGLLLQADDMVLTLPNRMKRWPVPAMSV